MCVRFKKVLHIHRDPLDPGLHTGYLIINHRIECRYVGKLRQTVKWVILSRWCKHLQLWRLPDHVMS